MHNDFGKLTQAAADRNEHELVEHNLIFGAARDEKRPRFGDHAIFTGRGRRARIGMNLP